jgi:acyl-CoA reductase-like NAD-dependent aldehyde dehydrogenase
MDSRCEFLAMWEYIVGTLALLYLVRIYWNNYPILAHQQVKAALPKEEGGSIEKNDIKDPNDPYLIVCYNPATGQLLGKRRAMNRSQVKQIVEKAKIAQRDWARSSFAKRRAVLQTLLDWIVQNQELICQVVSRDGGKTAIDANFGEILTTCEKLRWTIAHGESALKAEYRMPGLIMIHKIPRVEYVPVGVMGAIVSWNYPFHNAIGPVISALMAGNACVVKCSEQVAWTTEFLQSIFDSLLSLYGIDTSLVHFVNGLAEAGEALVENCDKITFIGSPHVGKLVMKHASNTLTPVVLELGGKDCALVLQDCDYDQFLKNSQRYAFQNAGQNCAGLERVIIHDSLYEKYLADISLIANRIRVGAPLEEETDLGAITMAPQIRIIQTLVDDAVSKGALVLCGGKPFIHPNYPKGQFFMPTVITNVTPEMRIYREEVFGPVLIVFKFDTLDEAIDIANGSGFGLGSGVFSTDYAKAQRIGKQIRAGFTNINDFGVNYLCQGLPFGGVGISGVDCFAGVEGLRGNCFPKATTTDAFGFLGVRTKLPELLQYPITPKGQQFQESLIHVLYGSMIDKVKGIIKLMK